MNEGPNILPLLALALGTINTLSLVLYTIVKHKRNSNSRNNPSLKPSDLAALKQDLLFSCKEHRDAILREVTEDLGTIRSTQQELRGRLDAIDGRLQSLERKSQFS